MKPPTWHSPHSIKNSIIFYLIRMDWSSPSNKIVKSPPFSLKRRKITEIIKFKYAQLVLIYCKLSGTNYTVAAKLLCSCDFCNDRFQEQTGQAA